MESIVVEAAKAVPALIVLIFMIIRFLSALKERDGVLTKFAAMHGALTTKFLNALQERDRVLLEMKAELASIIEKNVRSLSTVTATIEYCKKNAPKSK